MRIASFAVNETSKALSVRGAADTIDPPTKGRDAQESAKKWAVMEIAKAQTSFMFMQNYTRDYPAGIKKTPLVGNAPPLIDKT